MTIYYMICFFIVGACMGSFFTVVGYRLPVGESIIRPKRSYCPTCHNRLGTSELVPIFSYLFQKGKCKHCHKKISLFYPIVEILTGLLYAVSFYSFGFTPKLIISLTIASLLIIVIISDINFLIIPDEVTLVSAIIIIIMNFIDLGFHGGLLQIASGIFMFLVMYGLMVFGNHLFHKESLGGGDIKLMFVVGLVLHPILGLLIIFLSSFIALPVALILYWTHREKVIPFGPFILIALNLVYLMKIDVSMLERILEIL